MYEDHSLNHLSILYIIIIIINIQESHQLYALDYEHPLTWTGYINVVLSIVTVTAQTRITMFNKHTHNISTHTCMHTHIPIHTHRHTNTCIHMHTYQFIHSHTDTYHTHTRTYTRYTYSNSHLYLDIFPQYHSESMRDVLCCCGWFCSEAVLVR